MEDLAKVVESLGGADIGGYVKTPAGLGWSLLGGWDHPRTWIRSLDHPTMKFGHLERVPRCPILRGRKRTLGINH